MIEDADKETKPTEKYDSKKCLGHGSRKITWRYQQRGISIVRDTCRQNRMKPTEFQPRKYFREESLTSLAETIKEDGCAATNNGKEN